MGVFKNDVGRPSNKTIIIRRILNGILILIGLCLVAYISYYIGNKNDKTANEKPLNDSKEAKTTITTTTTTTSKVNEKTFDKNRITTEDKKDNVFRYLYVYDKKVDIGVDIADLGKIETIDDIAIIELLTAPDPVLIIVNTNGDILYNTMSQNNGVYCTDKTNECKSFTVKDNKINYYLENLGQDQYNVCVPYYDKEVLAEYEISYKKGVLSSTKKVASLMTGSEYVKKHNFDCSNIK